MSNDNIVKLPYSGEQIVPAHADDAALDLRSDVDAVIEPGHRFRVMTDTSISVPVGFVGMVCPRSGLAAKHGVTVLNAPGIIDPGYIGKLQVVLLNTDLTEPFVITKGDRIAQLMIHRNPKVELEHVDELDASSARGQNGFGSTGVQ